MKVCQLVFSGPLLLFIASKLIKIFYCTPFPTLYNSLLVRECQLSFCRGEGETDSCHKELHSRHAVNTFSSLLSWSGQ